MKHLKSLAAILPLFILFVACSVELPSYVISEGKMERILYDYHMAQGMAEAQGGDVEKNRYLYVQKVFEKHGITEAQFDTSMVWYSGHASHLTEMYERIEARMDRESNEAGLNIPEEDRFARFTAVGDTANIWQGNEIQFLNGNREGNLYTLVIPADTSFRKGDYFMLRFGNRFIVQDGQREGYALLQIRYENDSVVGSTVMVSGDYDVSIDIPETQILAKQTIRSIACTFYYHFDETKEDAFRLWAIRKPVLLRYHSLKKTEEEEEVADTLEADTLASDSAARSADRGAGERISPEEFRENQQVDRKINVIQKRNVTLPKKVVRRRVR